MSKQASLFVCELFNKSLAYLEFALCEHIATVVKYCYINVLVRGLFSNGVPAEDVI
jgi:hypothetical protein